MNPSPESLQTEYEAHISIRRRTLMNTTEQVCLDPRELEQNYLDYKVSLCRSSRASATRVSDLGHPCSAYIAFTRVAGETANLPNPVLACIFAEGRTQERQVYQDLEAMGFDVTQSQRSLYWPQFEISGHPDARISKPGMKAIPLEVKSCSPFTYLKINSEADLRNHKNWIFRKWSVQCQAYMLLESEEEYWLLLKNKATGTIKIIPIRLDLEYTEQFLKKAEIVREAVKMHGLNNGMFETWLLGHRLNDAAICADCPFKATCLPAIDSGPGAFLMEGEMEEMLNERAKVQDSSKRFEELDAEIKDAAKRVFDGGHMEIVCGNWHIKGVAQERKGKKFWVTQISKIAEKM